MNNEEKILQILEQMQGDMSDMRGDISGLKTDVSSLKTDVKQLQITQENVTNKNIQLLMEAQHDNARKLDTVQATLDDMAPTVTALDVMHQMQ